eukprot:1144612-Pelagomonas_calceolata.AAC.5
MMTQSIRKQAQLMCQQHFTRACPCMHGEINEMRGAGVWQARHKRLVFFFPSQIIKAQKHSEAEEICDFLKPHGAGPTYHHHQVALHV